MSNTDQISVGAPAGRAEKTILGHPSKLFILFSTEMWERFGYYGMRAILLLYLTKHFLFDDKQGVAIYTSYVSLVYLTPVIGGLIADRYLGFRNAVKLGAVLMAIGYFLLAFGGAPAKEYVEFRGNSYPVIAQTKGGESAGQFLEVNGQQLKIGPAANGGLTIENGEKAGLSDVIAKSDFTKRTERNANYVYLMYLALAIIIIGNGFFKPNISTMVGDLYSPKDTRRDSAFTIFYMGINLGAFLGQILLPNLRRELGFDAAFLAAAIGMTLALIIAFASDKALKDYGKPPKPEALGQGVFLGIPLGVLICLLSVIAVIPTWLLIQNDPDVAAWVLSHCPAWMAEFIGASPLVGILLLGGGLSIFTFILLFTLFKHDKVTRDRMIVALTLTFFSILFWALFEQAGTSLTLFADRNTDRNIFGWNMPADQVQFFNALFIILFAPILGTLWAFLGARGWEPPTPVKFSIGLVLVGAGFLALVVGGKTANEAALVSISWLALTYFIHTIGELFLSPVGLSMITRLSAPSMVGLMMGVWFLSTAMAQYVGGIIAAFTATETFGGQVLDPAAALKGSLEVFQTIGLIAVGVGVFLFVVSPFLTKMMRQNQLSDDVRVTATPDS